jgi:hypothetical protein
MNPRAIHPEMPLPIRQHFQSCGESDESSSVQSGLSSRCGMGLALIGGRHFGLGFRLRQRLQTSVPGLLRL